MRKLMLSLPVLFLIVITAFVSLVFNDYMIDAGLNPRDALLITIMAVVCYLLGALGIMAYAKVSKQKDAKDRTL